MEIKEASKVEILTKEIFQHKQDVEIFAKRIIKDLLERISKHDDSKFLTCEFEALTIIKDMKFGTPEYEKVLQSPGLKHHYLVNDHHPEFFKNKINGMNLLNLFEYFVDCFVAALRRSKSFPDFTKLQGKHEMSDQLLMIFQNTVEYFKNYSFEDKYNHPHIAFIIENIVTNHVDIMIEKITDRLEKYPPKENTYDMPHWRSIPVKELINHLKKEVVELEEAYEMYLNDTNDDNLEEIGKESADVSNISMMIFDRISHLHKTGE